MIEEQVEFLSNLAGTGLKSELLRQEIKKALLTAYVRGYDAGRFDEENRSFVNEDEK